MTWRQTEVDERYRVTFTVWRCGGCRKQAVTLNGAQPTDCVCSTQSARRKKR